MISTLRPPIAAALLCLGGIAIASCDTSPQPNESVPYFTIQSVMTVTINGVPSQEVEVRR